ncbi:hypothetical protein BBJ28_00025022 [Nothophytophthora sp. Chile5]|nr:hypothetical protein BBJ28_00025022 [Nothophytophthora sp. Chile5]
MVWMFLDSVIVCGHFGVDATSGAAISIAIMAVTGKRGVGIPTILLHDGEGTIVSIEMKTGETYRGLLDETEDNMNCVMKDAVRTDINGNTSQVEQVYLRGSQILFIVFPDIYPPSPTIPPPCCCVFCAASGRFVLRIRWYVMPQVALT